jgi:hypothetical protein
VVHTSPEVAEWFAGIVPEAADPERSLVLDGDLPRADWFAGVPHSRRRSEEDGEIHTVVPGRPIGLHPEDVADLAAEGIHLHFHGSFTQGRWRDWIDRTRRLAPDHLHLHETIGPEDWVRVFSRYDAGWLHTFRSKNGGELAAADWDDLNLPARMATFAAAGLPMIQRDNTGSRVAVQTVGRELGVGLFYRRPDDLAATLRDPVVMDRLRANVRAHAAEFTFDHHVDRLLGFLRRAADIGTRRRTRRGSGDAASVVRDARANAGTRPAKAGTGSGEPNTTSAERRTAPAEPRPVSVESQTATTTPTADGLASVSLPAWMPSDGSGSVPRA